MTAILVIFIALSLPFAKQFLVWIYPSGTGPSEAQRKKQKKTECSATVYSLQEKSLFNRTTAVMSGGDPGYDETSKMLAECAGI
jgi:hypothetical protein